MRERLIEIIRKEFRQAFREPRMRFLLFLAAIRWDVGGGQ